MSKHDLYIRPVRPRRSVLYVPADNARALEKSLTLNCDCVIYDLEDAILPDQKVAARDQLKMFFKERIAEIHKGNDDKELIIRINGLATEWGPDDLSMVAKVLPSAMLLPKVAEIDDLIELNDLLHELEVPNHVRSWAMIETPKGVLNASSIAQYARTPGTRLDCFVVGTNDLLKETGAKPMAGRPYISSWLTQIILAARSYDLDVIDGVYNDFRDPDGFREETEQSVAMGFDGRTLIHPNQIALSNESFGVSDEELEESRDIIQAFKKPENADAGVIQIGGKMVERLHLEMAQKIVEKADIIKRREG